MDMNEKRLQVLCNKITEKGKKGVKTLDDVINNIEALAQEKTVNGEVEMYLPLQEKEEIFHLIYPNGYIDANVELNVSLQMAMAKATVYDDDGKVIGVGFADQKVNLMPVFEGSDVCWQGVRRLAKGRATSDALRAAGIASWFKDDPMFSQAVDNYDADKTDEGPSEDRSKEISEKLKAAEKKPITKETTDTANTTATADAAAIAADIPSVDEEEIPFEVQDPHRAYVLHGGAYDGKTIGEVEKIKPSYLASCLKAYEAGKMPKADPELINSLKAVVG